MPRWGNVYERPLPGESYSRVGHQSYAAMSSSGPERRGAALLSVVLDALGVFICSIDIDTFN